MTRQHPPRRATGFSLIELLVAMVIGLVVSVAITSVVIRTEGSKRSSTSVNDINQSGAYAAYVLDRIVRSAGSGFSQRWSEVYGCTLDVNMGTTHVLPIPAAAPATSAFTNLPLTLRLAPVIIGKGLADKTGDVRGDVLIVMGGTAGVGESPQSVKPGSVSASPANLRLENTLGYRTDDMLLLADATVGGGCMMQQVATRSASEYGQDLALGGTYYAAAGTGVNLTDFGASTLALQLGRDDANPPQFQAFGVGANRTLMSYDLLQPQPGGTALPDASIADGVVEMRAVYGLDTTSTPDGILDSWLDPTAGSGYEASVLGDGSAASRVKLRRIVAVRIGMILRTSLQERAPQTTASSSLGPEGFQQASGRVLTLFSDLPTAVQQTRTLGSGDLNYRFRTLEVTVPLRNVLMAPNT
jgi:type IV pilus assembly protein PilW